MTKKKETPNVVVPNLSLEIPDERRLEAIAALARMGEALAHALETPVAVHFKEVLTCNNLTIGGSGTSASIVGPAVAKKVVWRMEIPEGDEE